MIFLQYLCSEKQYKFTLYMSSLFDKSVSINAVMYILSVLGGRSDMHRICKILYFADQLHLSRYSRSITGADYIRMNYGPVPSQVDDMFKAVRGDSYFSDTSEADWLKEYFSFYNRYTIDQKKQPNMDYLSETDIECLNEAIERCKGKNFSELTEMSHGIAWQNTQQDRKMSIKDILREAGDSEEYVEYIDQKLRMENLPNVVVYGVTC